MFSGDRKTPGWRWWGDRESWKKERNTERERDWTTLLCYRHRAVIPVQLLCVYIYIIYGNVAREVCATRRFIMGHRRAIFPPPVLAAAFVRTPFHATSADAVLNACAPLPPASRTHAHTHTHTVWSLWVWCCRFGKYNWVNALHCTYYIILY